MTLSYLVHPDFHILHFLKMGVHLYVVPNSYRLGIEEPRIMANIYQKGHPYFDTSFYFSSSLFSP